MSSTHITLFRGINVGGNNRIKMGAIKDAFATAGAEEVTTYIQSGNVIFDAKNAASVVKNVASTLKAEHGLEVPMVTVSAAAFLAAEAACPFVTHAQKEPKFVHAFFPLKAPAADAITALEEKRSPPDVVAFASGVLYLWTPNGMARTKFTSAVLDKTLGTVVTGRNWKTIGALCALMKERD